jgi:hypothetical protein
MDQTNLVAGSPMIITNIDPTYADYKADVEL